MDCIIFYTTFTDVIKKQKHLKSNIMKNLLIIIAVIAVIALVFSIIALVVAYNYSNLAETNMSAKLVLDVVKMYLFA